MENMSARKMAAEEEQSNAATATIMSKSESIIINKCVRKNSDENDTIEQEARMSQVLTNFSESLQNTL